MHNNTTPTKTQTNVLGALRALLPNRQLCLAEALRLAELQADRLLRLRAITGIPVPTEIVTTLPRITVEHDADLPRHAASGVSRWDDKRKSWVISLNHEEPQTRQRFTVLHEYKHIIDHYHPGLGGWLPHSLYGSEPVEYVAEYFAACVLMPKRWVKAAFFDGIQKAWELAELFEVSTRAMQVRLHQLGLSRVSDQPTPAPRYRLQPAPRPRPSSRPMFRHAIAQPLHKEAT